MLLIVSTTTGVGGDPIWWCSLGVEASHSYPKSYIMERLHLERQQGIGSQGLILA